MNDITLGLAVGAVGFLFGSFCLAAAYGLRLRSERDALRRELERRDAALLASLERENGANMRAGALRRALDAAHEAQDAQHAQQPQPGRTCRHTVVYIPVQEYRHLRTVIGEYTHN